MGAMIESVGFAFGCRRANGFRRSTLILASGWVGRERRRRREEEEVWRYGEMEKWKNGRREGKGREPLGGEWISAGAWAFYEVNSVADEDHTPKWL